jgi:hypothetical protein
MAYLLILVAMLALIALFVWLLTRRDIRQNQLDKRDRAELEDNRRTLDAITRLTVDHMDVEPFARIVWDELRNGGRKEIS